MPELNIEKIRLILDETHILREKALKLSRETIRFCANSIRASHRQEFEKADELIAEARNRVLDVKEMLKDKPEIYYTGYVLDAQKEYGEAVLTNTIIKELDFPTFEDLGIEAAVYLNSLAEAAGETRRYSLDELRRGNMQKAEKALEVMDDIYYMLITIDYPDAITQGLRRHTDMVRGVLEKTRSEITLIKQQQNLENKLKEAIDKLG